MIIDNNIENKKNRLLWEEQAYQISKRSNGKLKSPDGSKSAGNCKKIRNNVKNCFFSTSNPHIFVSFQNFLLKFGMHVPEIKIHFFIFFILSYIFKNKSYLEKKRNFSHNFLFFAITGQLGTPMTFSFFIWSFWNLVCFFLL